MRSFVLAACCELPEPALSAPSDEKTGRTHRTSLGRHRIFQFGIRRFQCRSRNTAGLLSAWMECPSHLPNRKDHLAAIHCTFPANFFLQPTADRGLVARILVVEVALEKPFFSWDHNHRYQADSWNERYQKPEVIQPNRQSEHDQGERQINGIAAEPVGAGSHDCCRPLGSSHRSASCAKFSEGKQEEQYGAKGN